MKSLAEDLRFKKTGEIAETRGKILNASHVKIQLQLRQKILGCLWLFVASTTTTMIHFIEFSC